MYLAFQLQSNRIGQLGRTHTRGCNECRGEFFFDLVDWEERDDGDIRVVAFADLPPGSFQRLIEACRMSTSTPGWPIWIPIWKFQSEEGRKRANQIIKQLLGQKGDYNFMVAMKGNWFQSILSIKNIRPDDLQDITESLKMPRSPQRRRDWLSFMDIIRHE